MTAGAGMTKSAMFRVLSEAERERYANVHREDVASRGHRRHREPWARLGHRISIVDRLDSADLQKQVIGTGGWPQTFTRLIYGSSPGNSVRMMSSKVHGQTGGKVSSGRSGSPAAVNTAAP